MDTPIEECEKRDQQRGRGLFARARAGELQDLTGFHDTDDARYDRPESPELYLDTVEYDIEACVAKVWHYMTEKGLKTW